MATITVDRSINVDDAFSMSGGTPCFVSLQSGATAYQTNLTGYSTWVTANMPSTSNWQSVCYGNNILVAVSSTSGTIAATSPAGVSATWTARTLPATASWYAVAYGLEKFVAVSSGASTAGAYSPDGAKWTSTGALPASGNWRSLAFGNDRFVTLSYGATDSAYSTNGTSWTAGGALPATRNWTSVCYGGSKFVAVAAGTDRGAYSTDGTSWTEMTMPSSSNWNWITYGNGKFVAVSNTTGTVAAYSSDGITWQSSTLPNSRAWVGVAFGNNLFTAIASGSTSGGAFSYDGINWQAITTLSQTATCIAYTPTTWNSNDTLAITNNSTVTVNTNQSKFWNAVTLTNGKLVISNTSTSIGNAIRFTMGRVTGASAAAITPGSGIGDIEISGNWIELGTGNGSSGQEMTAPFSDYIPTLWVETASGSGVYEVWLNATGTYGNTYPSSGGLLVEGLSAVGSGARGKFFIQNANSDPYGPTIINSTDGSLAQKLITVTSTTGLYAGASVFGPGIATNAVVNRVISSTQLELNANTTTEVSPDWSSVAYGNSTYVAVSKTYSNIAATSSDGVTWTKRTLPFVADWTSVCYGATTGLFVAVASHGVYGTGFCATSADGITWTQRAMPTTMNYTSVASNGTSYVAVGQTAANAATTAAASSTDGVTWVAATMATSQIWNAVAYGGGRYVAIGTGTATNYDADGAGTWTAGATVPNVTNIALAYSGSLWVVVSGSSTASHNKADPTTGAFTVGGVLPNAYSRGIAWDGTNFVVTSIINSGVGSTQTARSTNGTTWTTTTLTGTQIGNWTCVTANGTTLVAMSVSSNNRSYAMTSTDSGATWTVQTGTPLDVSLVCFNPYVSQLTNTVKFGDGVNGKKVPTGAKVRCPNIMFTSAVPANIETSARGVGANMVMTNGGSLTANICLFDESLSNFGQTEILSITNCGFSFPPLITECYGLTINSVGFALEPVRRYFAFSATTGSYGWFTRDTRYGITTNAWNYINGAVITDLNMAIGQPLSLTANQTGGTVTAPAACLYITNTEGSTWTNIRFYGLNINHNFQNALSLTSLFNNNTITNLEAYGLGPLMLGVSSGNTITNITTSEDMFNGYKNFASGYRIGNDPVAGTHLADNTKYYIKLRTFRDWTDRSNFYESRVYSATPYLGDKFHPQSLSVYNSGAQAITATWVRRDPTSATVSYTLFRGTSAGFTRDSSSRVYYNATAATVTYTNGYVAQVTASGGRTITFAQAGRTITASSGSFITDGFVAGANVVVAGTTNNNGTYIILSLTATVITLTTNHTNLVNEGPLSATATLSGQVPANGTTYYYRLQKYDSALSGITNAAGTASGTTLTIPSGSFNTGLGTIANCEGTSGSNKIRIPVGSTTNFYAGNVTIGLQIAGTGVGTGATVTSIDSPWQITVSVVNASTFLGQTLTLGATAGMYIYGPGIAWPTKVVSVDSATQITVDTAFLATFSGQTITFMYGSESAEIECLCTGAATAAFNFLTYSDDFSNAAWVKTNATVTTNQRLGPNDLNFGSNLTLANTADRLLSTGPTGKVVQTITNLKSGSSYTFSVYVMTDVTAQSQTVTGEIAINTTSPTTQSFTANGKWQRITATFTATSGTHTFTIQINKEGCLLYVANAMVNTGSSALAPILTTTVKLATGSGGRTLTFASSGTVHTITASSGSFSTDGFVAGDSIIVSGTTSNDGQYVLSNVAATVLTITPAQPLVAEGPISTGTITGSVLAAAAQELTLVAAWSRSLGGNDTNQGVELTLATIPAGAHYSEIYLGTSSGFTPTDTNRVGYASMPGSNAVVSLSNSNENRVTTLNQEGYGGLTSYLLYLTGSSDNKFFEFTRDFNYGVSTASVATIQNLSNNNVLDDFTITNWRNYIATITPFTLLNNTSGVIVQNMTFNHYDIPYYTSATNSGLGVIMKGVTGGHAEPATNATIFALGGTSDSLGVSFTAVYDTMFHENFRTPTTGALAMRFNASSSDTPPYSVVSGTPAFSNTGRLYLRTAGDSMEFVWPHKIYTVSGFRDLPIKYNTYDLGQATTTNPDSAFSLKTEYAIDTGSGYSAYKVATPANLAGETVSTTTGFYLKIKITARAGMMFSTQTNPFEIGETIEGATSGATAVVDEIYKLTTTTGTIILSSITGTFLPAELVRRASDDQTRATNVVTNTQFALFPSFNSYIDGLEIYTNTVGPGDYAGQTVSITLTNVVAGSTYYVYKTSDLSLLGSGTAASSTVTIPGVPYIADFGITVRVRKASSAPKYIPLETQATVNSAGVSVYIGQSLDPVAS